MLLTVNGSDPSDDVLRAAFLQFAKENNGAGLNYQDQLARLSNMGLCIKYESFSLVNFPILTSHPHWQTQLAISFAGPLDDTIASQVQDCDG